MRALAILVTGFCLTGTPVLAQGEGGSGIQLSYEQERSLYETLSKQRIKAPPADWQADVGARVPRSVALYRVPQRTDPAPLRRYRYTVANSRVVLVEPATRTIVRLVGVGM
jgi:hypothetical protein